MIPKTPVSIHFGALDQETSPRHLRILGALTVAENVRQPKKGRYQKRFGFAKLNKTTDTGTITTAQGLAATSASVVMQADDVLYSRDASASLWRNRGGWKQPFPTYKAVLPFAGTFPTFAVTGNTIAYFAVANGSNNYYVSMHRLDTGVALADKQTIAIAGGVDQMKAVAAGGFFWLFYRAGGSTTTIKVAKFNPSSPSTAPTVTTFMSAPASATDPRFDVIEATGGVAFAVKFGGNEAVSGGTGSHSTWMAFLDTATGGAAVSPGWVSDDLNYGGGNYFGEVAPYWINHTGSSGFLYWASHGNDGQYLAKMSATNFSGLTITLLNATIGDNDRMWQGYVDGSSVVVLHSDASDGTNQVAGSTDADKEQADITKYVVTAGVVTTTANYIRGKYLASQPFQYSSAWYVVTAHDDRNNLQRSYYLHRLSDGKVIAQALYGLGGNVFLRGKSTDWLLGGVSLAYTSGTKVLTLVNSSIGTNEWSSVRIDWDFSPTYGPLVTYANGKNVLVPGGAPIRMGVSDGTISELVPRAFPRTIGTTNAAGSLTTTRSAQAVYVLRDTEGNYYRSSPSQAVSVSMALGGSTLTIPTLRHTNLDNADVGIEIYATTASGQGPYLLATLANDKTAETVSYSWTAVDVSVGAEPLYTAGGFLGNWSPPPFRFATVWRDRMWLGGTPDDGEVWFSKEFVVGKGPEFAPLLKVTLFGGRGGVLAAGAVSHDYLALFKEEQGIYVLSGPGPDDTGGGGSYTPQLLPADLACNNPKSVVTYPGGCLFQARDGGIYRVGLDLQVTYVGSGVDDYRDTVVASVHFAKEQQVKFWLSTAKCLTLHYGAASETQPLGVWSVDYSSDLGVAAGAAVFSDAVNFVETDGEVRVETSGQYFDGTNTPVLAIAETFIQFADLGGEVRVSRGQVVGEYKSAHDLRITLTADGGTAVVLNKSVAAGPEKFTFRTSGMGHVSELRVKVEERGTGTGEGFYLDGLYFEVQQKGKGQHLPSGQRF